MTSSRALYLFIHVKLVPQLRSLKKLCMIGILWHESYEFAVFEFQEVDSIIYIGLWK